MELEAIGRTITITMTQMKIDFVHIVIKIGKDTENLMNKSLRKIT